jgi:hypothetical protein
MESKERSNQKQQLSMIIEFIDFIRFEKDFIKYNYLYFIEPVEDDSQI